MDANALTDWERRTLLSWFMHHMAADQRHKLMTTFPEWYNRMADKEIMSIEIRRGER